MATKCIIVGEDPKIESKLIPIEFCKVVTYDNEPFDNNVKPNEFKYVELIALNYQSGYDLIFAYNNQKLRGDGHLYFGHWNDGVVY
jgi:hypothetical protein